MSTSRARTARREELRAWYDDHVDGFRAVEAALLDHLGGALREARLDDARLETRTKDVESFLTRRQSPTAAAASSTPIPPAS